MLDLKVNRSAFSDPAFTENRASGIHRWVPWIAGFSAAFVAEAIDKHAPDGGLIVDPFAGVGTTLLETVRRGVAYEAMGFEINPYAAFAAHAKLEAARLRVAEVRRTADRFRREAPTAAPAAEPAGFHSRILFYSPRVLAQVLRALGWIHKLKSEQLRELFLLAFSSVMVKFSNYSYEPSLTSRPAVGKALVEDADVFEMIAGKLDDMAEDIASLQRDCPPPGVGKVHTGSWAAADGLIEEGSIQLIVTSPPYANNYHYLRNTRPQLYWLGFATSPDGLKAIEQASFGKFWQTVRDLPPIPLQFDFPELEATLGKLRTLNTEKGHYGGGGWANYLATYFNDSYEFLRRFRRLLSPGGVAVIVIGNSIVQGMDIRTDEILAHLAESDDVGLRAERLEVARGKRVGNSIINSSVRTGPAKTATLYESILTLRR
ncbi:MAG: site-specific DNA-methyltransferase [Acidobacteria bacterium]|nr:site-specific DNA-methyltransferase [Acidobacteriota bacterium]